MLAKLAAALACLLSVPPALAEEALSPWALTYFQLFFPGRPEGVPRVNLTVAEGNEVVAGRAADGSTVRFAATGANCSKAWAKGGSAKGGVVECAPPPAGSSGRGDGSGQGGARWTFEVLEDKTYFDFRLVDVKTAEIDGVPVSQTWEGTARVEIAALKSSYAASANHWLSQPSDRVVYINQTRTA